MAYVSNQYNYATPLSHAALFIESNSVADNKYFTLHDNTLDGSYHPITGNVGIWGNSFADENGVLSSPLQIIITDNLYINAFRVVGSASNYPVDFTIDLYSGNALLRSIPIVGNNSAEYVQHFSSTLTITSVVLTVTRISSPGSVARLFNVYNPGYVKRVDSLEVIASEANMQSQLFTIRRADNLGVATVEHTPHVLNTINVTRDNLKVLNIDATDITNVHSRMKDPSRRVYGKVYITYTDPMLDSDTEVTSDSSAYNSNIEQTIDSVFLSDEKYFTLYENDLTGNYTLSDVDTQVGWVSGDVSGPNGYFNKPQVVTLRFAARPVVGLTVYFGYANENIPENFTVTLNISDGTSIVKTFTGNALGEVRVMDNTIADVVSVVVSITKSSKEGYPVSILDIPVTSTLLYKGYADESELMSIDLLEELTYEDEIEALGGVSANEVTVVLDNSNKDFYFNNPDSLIAKQLKRNRKIVPWLGVEVTPGEIEWYTLGTFWSYKWNVPTNSLTASVVGFDTIGLLDTTDFIEHQVQIDKSLGELIEYVLVDAKRSLDFIEFSIDPALYEIHIPYAWFENGSHTAALRKISKCYPMHIYCDRQGRICAAPQKLHLDYYYDTWADSTNVIDKSYDSLYTTLPNVVNVSVVEPKLVKEQLVQDTIVFSVPNNVSRISTTTSRTLTFNKPYVSDFDIEVDCDANVTYEYTVYSWGVVVTFAGNGTVRSITCSGTAIDTSSTSIVSHIDTESVHINGAVTRNVQADFIQTSDLAETIIGRLFSLSELDKYDAKVDYRGDIALTINDPILLLDGIAPDNRYNIKRHQLFWNGALSGSADLNT